MNKLRPKYQVQRLEPIEAEGVYENKGIAMLSTDPGDIDSPFVLMPRKDPAAFAALVIYSEHCEPELANEIKAWLYKIAEAEPVFGTQGARNFRVTRLKPLES